MAEVSLPEEPIVSSTSSQEANAINEPESSRITVRIDDEEEEELPMHVEAIAPNSNNVEKNGAFLVSFSS